MVSGRVITLGVNERPTAAFVLSLVSGVLILAGSGFAVAWFWYGMPALGDMMGQWGMMPGMMGGFFFGAAAIGLVSGVLVLIGAFMLYSHPQQASTWGVIILIFAVLSFFSGGGFFIGAILGLVGGILALTWRPG